MPRLPRNPDRIRFYEVDANDLLETRETFASSTLEVQMNYGAIDYGRLGRVAYCHQSVGGNSINAQQFLYLNPSL